MRRRLSVIICMMLSACCLVVMCIPASSFAMSKPKTPENVKIITDLKGDASSGIRIFAKYKKVRGVDGYQIKSSITYRRGSDGTGPIITDTKKTSTKKTKKMLSKNADYRKATVKVRSYIIRNGERVYSKWSKTKTKKF